MTQAAQTSSTANGHELLASQLTIPEHGHLYVYVINQTAGEFVYFDDLSVQITTAPVVQVDDYYPGGLTFNSYTSGEKNKYLFNGKEIQEETDLYDFGARMYDPWLGRFHTVDPLAMIFQSFTPYQYGLNNPLRFEDWEGMGPGDRVNPELSLVNISNDRH